MNPQAAGDRTFLAALGLSLAVMFAWSAIAPHDRLTWVLEMLPVPIALALLAATYRRFTFSRLAYAAMWAHAVILLVGGHYTYAEVPAFNWLRDTFDLARNHYDRVGHVAQGFFPAIVAREILLRLSPLVPGKWLFFLVTAVCLAISAFYEMIEWWVALASAATATAFLATQGDVWDTQWDMFLALCGALAAQLLLGRVHDRAIRARLGAGADAIYPRSRPGRMKSTNTAQAMPKGR
jgi:putative membrane protein